MIIDGNKIKSEEGKILTDGIAYGRSIRLGEGRSAEEFHEITEEEYEEIVKAQEEEAENDDNS